MASLQSLYLFPVYQTREEYRAKRGVEAPPFDLTRPVKSWFDPAAAASPRRKLVYDNVIALADNGSPLSGPDGQPFLEPLLIDREKAATVNIPVKDFTGKIQETPTIGFEVPVPCRALSENETLVFGWGGAVQVVESNVDQTIGFGPEDRRLLKAIAKKLGV